MQEQTDDEHYITMPEIMDGLAKYDVTADRKSVYGWERGKDPQYPGRH